MGNIWTVARQTVAEGIRMKIALFLILVLAVLLLGLPFASKGDNSVSGAVQAFLAYSITTVTFLLSCLTIFMSKSLSDDFVSKQILVLMSKPLSRWKYIVGKWLGIVLLNLAILLISGVTIYGMTRYLASKPPMDQWDADRLENHVLTARHASQFIAPDYRREANAQYDRYREEGRYVLADRHSPEYEKERLRAEIEQRWRSVWPGESRTFEFDDVRCPRGPDQFVHLRYEPRIINFPPDEIVRCYWVFGNREKGTDLYRIDRRDYVDRRHTVSVPSSAVADDNTLTATLVNMNPFSGPGEVQFPNSIVFEGDRGVEVLFPVSSFESNLARALCLVMCRLAFLAAVGVLATSVLSFPVACLVALSVYILATMHGFLENSVEYLEREGALGVIRTLLQHGFDVVYLLVPNFGEVNGLELLVDGRNVTLMWVLWLGLGKLVVIQTGLLLLIACLIFQRREVSEVSV